VLPADWQRSIRMFENDHESYSKQGKQTNPFKAPLVENETKGIYFLNQAPSVLSDFSPTRLHEDAVGSPQHLSFAHLESLTIRKTLSSTSANDQHLRLLPPAQSSQNPQFFANRAGKKNRNKGS